MNELETLIVYASAHRYLRYEKETGKLYWKESPGRRIRAGDEAGCLSSLKKCEIQYIRVRLHGVEYPAHRLIWLMVHGKWPKDDLDHESGDGRDNKLENLREADTVVNGQNRTKDKRNKSGFTGVCYATKQGKWMAYISVNKRIKHLGLFTSKEEAIAARKAANIEYGYHENHGRERVT